MFDLDYAGAALAWEKAHLPPPTLTVTNPENGHAHLLYGLFTPVVMSDAARDAPIRYAAALQAALLAKLCADPGYAGLIAKNPFHEAWNTQWLQQLYTLGDLAEYVSLPKRLPKRSELAGVGLGRNCTLFDELRAWAYQWVREYQSNDASTAQWHSAVLGQAERLNAFDLPLAFNEVKAVAKSVARWTWLHFSDAAFSALQSVRGKRGGRPKTTTLDGSPWDLLEMSRATYYRQVKSGLLVPTVGLQGLDTELLTSGETKAISDNSTQPPPAGGEGDAQSYRTRLRERSPSIERETNSQLTDRLYGSTDKHSRLSRDTAQAEAKAWAYWEYCSPGTRGFWAAEWEKRKTPNAVHPRSVMPLHWPPLLLDEPDVMTSEGPVPYIEQVMRRVESNLLACGRAVPWGEWTG